MMANLPRNVQFISDADIDEAQREGQYQRIRLGFIYLGNQYHICEYSTKAQGYFVVEIKTQNSNQNTNDFERTKES